jgi:uncharacterized membrane protein
MDLERGYMATEVNARGLPITRARSRWLSEPLLVLLLYGVLWLLIGRSATQAARVLISAGLALFGSGYSFVAVLYPRPADLDGVSRAALAGALSLAMGGATGFLLSLFPGGLTLPSFMLAMVVFNVVCYFLALSRRWDLMYTEQPRWPSLLEPALNWWDSQSPGSRAVTGVLALFLVSGIGALYQAAVTPAADPPMTEFYLLDQNGHFDNLPREATPGQSLTVTYGIANREAAQSSDQVRVMIDGQVVGGSWPVQLSPGQVQQSQVQVAVPANAQGNTEIQFILYRDGQPYRALRLPITVKR